MPSSSASARGVLAEEAAARKFRLDVADVGGDGPVDLDGPDGPVSVKSAVHTRADGNPGRFRFQARNFERLAARDGAGVVLVLFPSIGSGSRRPIKVVRLEAGDVQEAIADAGGWVRAGHQSFTHQRRLPWPSLLE